MYIMYIVEFENLVRSGPFVQALIRITLSTAVSRSSITDSQYHNSDSIFFMQFIIEDILYIFFVYQQQYQSLMDIFNNSTKTFEPFLSTKLKKESSTCR